MPQIISNNAAINPSAPDIIINVISPPTSIQGAPTNVVGVVGSSSWGPLNTPVLLGSLADVAKNFGPPQVITTTNSANQRFDLSTDLSLAFQEAQGASLQVWAVRVDDGTSVKATGTLVDTAPATGVTIKGIYSGTLGNSISVSLLAGSKGAGFWTLTVSGPPGSQPQSEVYPNLGPAGGAGAEWQIIVNAITNGVNGVRGPSQLVTATIASSALPPAVAGQTITLTTGPDGVTTPDTVLTNMIGSDAAQPKTGLFSLRNLNPGVAYVYMPGFGDV